MTHLRNFGSPHHLHYALPFGAELLAPDRTRFRFWAPDCERVDVEIDGCEPTPMQRHDNGLFEVEAGCGAGTRYRYRINAQLAVPDPASRAQAGDIHDASLVVDPASYRWRNTAWQGRPWEETVLYELHVGAFGGFKGVHAHLAELASLGITAIELMPINDFPGTRNWGYDGVLPYAPDAAYGSPDELKALIDAAHGFGLMVFLDVVYNHFGPDGNYLSNYASSFFREDLKTPWGPAIDFRRQEVRDFFIENAIYWLMEYRFDGLRLDAVHAIADPEFPLELARRVRQATEPGRHVHLVLEHDGNLAHLYENGERGINAQWNDDMHHVIHTMLTDEAHGYYADYAEGAAAKLARALSEGYVYQGEPSAFKEGERRGEPSAHLPTTAFVSFLQNHDQIGNRAFGERLTVLATPRQLRAAMAMLLLCPHIPLVFMGEEWGSRQPFLYFTSHNGELAKAVRAGRRAEFAKFPDFSDPTRRDGIPDPNDTQTFLRSQPNRDELRSEGLHCRWLNDFRALLALRSRILVPRLRGCRSLGARPLGWRSVTAAWRLNDGQVLHLYANLGKEEARFAPELASAHNLEVIFDSDSNSLAAIRNGVLRAGSTLALLEDAR